MADLPAQAEAELTAEVPYDASDPQQVNQARKKAGRRKRNRLDFIERMMKEEEGRRWFWELMESCHIFDNPLVQGDPYATHFKIGEENIGKRILADVSQFPELYMKMCSEAKTNK